MAITVYSSLRPNESEDVRFEAVDTTSEAIPDGSASIRDILNNYVDWPYELERDLGPEFDGDEDPDGPLPAPPADFDLTDMDDYVLSGFAGTGYHEGDPQQGEKEADSGDNSTGPVDSPTKEEKVDEIAEK